MSREITTSNAATAPTLSRPDAQRLKHTLSMWGGVTEPLPGEVADLIPVALARIDRALMPATSEDLTALLARMWKSGVPCPDKDSLVEWMRLLSRYPADVLATAFDDLAKSYRWPAPPKVADAVRFIEPEMDRRNAWRRKLKTAKVRADMDAKGTAGAADTKPPTPEETKRLEERLRQFRATVGSGAAKSMPGVVKGRDGRGSASENMGMTDRDIPRLREAALRGLESAP